MRRVLIIASLAILLIVCGCTKDHDELLKDFPLPVVTQARLVESAPDEFAVEVAWEDANVAYADSYRVYFGFTVMSGSEVLDTDSLVGSVDVPEFTWDDIPDWMVGVSDMYCNDYGLCDSVYQYYNFRVSSVTSGVEGDKGPMMFITR